MAPTFFYPLRSVPDAVSFQIFQTPLDDILFRLPQIAPNSHCSKLNPFLGIATLSLSKNAEEPVTVHLLVDFI